MMVAVALMMFVVPVRQVQQRLVLKQFANGDATRDDRQVGRKGSLSAKLAFRVAGASAGARKAVEDAGGSIEIIEVKPASEKAAAKKGKAREARIADKAAKVEAAKA